MQEANECKVKYTCNLCGRNNFDAPSPHKCRGGFRKRGLTWSITVAIGEVKALHYR
jgi:hypothetical protein